METQEDASLSLRKAYYECRRLDIYDIVMVFYNRAWRVLFWKNIRPQAWQDVRPILKLTVDTFAFAAMVFLRII